MTLITPTLPVQLAAKGSSTLTIQYVPASAASVTGVVSINSGVFTFNVIGTSPSLTFSYYISPGGNATTLVSGSPISFPTTNVGSSTTAVVTVLNSGSGPGSLLSVTCTGTSYQVTSSPAGATLVAGQQISFNVVFTPSANGSAAGVLAVGLTNTTLVFPLSGSGAAPSLVVQYTLADNNVHTLLNGATIPFPSVDINSNTRANVQILNQGLGSGTVTSVSVTGAAFQLSGLPAMPATVAAGQSVSFAVLFAPTQSGSYTGALTINMSGGSISAILTGSTAASSFSVRYVDPTTNNVLPLSSGGTLPFPGTVAGSNVTITVQVANSGAGTGSISSISLSGAPSAFQLASLPPLAAFRRASPAGHLWNPLQPVTSAGLQRHPDA